MRSHLLLAPLLIAAAFVCSCQQQRQQHAAQGKDATDEELVVGPADGGGYIVSTKQLIRPAGQSVEFRGRPVDLALSPDGKPVYAKSSAQLLVIDAESWQIRQELK